MARLLPKVPLRLRQTSGSDAWLTAAFAILITLALGGLVYKFMPSSVSSWVQSTINSLLGQFGNSSITP